MVATILKPLADTLQVPMRANDVLGLPSVEVTPRGIVAGAAALVVVATLVPAGINLALSGGEDGEQYDLVARIETAGDVVERSLRIIVIEADWTMPDGTPGWISLIDFIDKYGFDEVLLATDADGAGMIDRRYLIGKLRDAQAECAANIPPQYGQPLSAVPDILRTAVADLARARLHPREVPDGVDSAARAQRQLLTRIASGAVPLPGVAGVAVESDQTSDAPIEFYSGGQAYPGGLGDY